MSMESRYVCPASRASSARAAIRALSGTAEAAESRPQATLAAATATGAPRPVATRGADEQQEDQRHQDQGQECVACRPEIWAGGRRRRHIGWRGRQGPPNIGWIGPARRGPAAEEKHTL